MIIIKGYHIPFGYMGYINGSYRLFATESEYIATWREENEVVAQSI